jgi:hypothetical protein
VTRPGPVATGLEALEGGLASTDTMAADGAVSSRARDELAAVDAALVTALVSGMTYAKAAEAAGVSLRTAQRRMADPAFRALVEAKRLELVDSALGLLLGSAELAALVLRNVAGRGQSEAARVAAAVALLDRGLRWDEHTALRRRIEALESALAGQR